MSVSAAVQGEGRSEDDEIHHQVREECPNSDIQLAGANFIKGRALSLCEAFSSRRLFLFYLLRCLPEEEVRANCGPKNRDQSFPSLLAVGQGRNECVVKSCAPVGMNNKCADDICEENECEPFEHAGNLVIT